MTTINPLAKSKLYFRLIPCLAFLALLVFSPLATAQQARNGSITGRVYDPAGDQYLRDVEVSIVGTQRTTTTEAGGYYTFMEVPPGDVTIQVKYTGLATMTKDARVGSGEHVTLDFDMLPPGKPIESKSKTGGDSNVVVMDKYAVSADREGSSKAIMQQKNSMDMKTVVATDSFGDVAAGNVGEFLKNLPGITLDYQEADTRYVSIGGMDAAYGAVTMDGANVASASSQATFGSDSRSFSFEQASINNIETVEVNTLGGADSPGDAPAGTINLKMKSAFDLKGRRINYNAYLMANSYYLSLGRSPGPGDNYGVKILPNVSIGYSNSYFRNTFGLTINVSHYETFSKQNRLTNVYSSNGNLGNPPPADDSTTPTESAVYVNRITYKDGPKTTYRNAGSIKADYRISPFAKTSLSFQFSSMDDDIHNRTVDFRTSGQSAANSSLTHVTSNASGYVDQNEQSMMKRARQLGGIWTFDIKSGRFYLESNVSYSHSISGYMDTTPSAPYVRSIAYRASAIAWTADRPDAASTAWTIKQTNVNADGSNNISNFSAWNPNGTSWITSNKPHSVADAGSFKLWLTWFAPSARPLSIKAGLEGKTNQMTNYRTSNAAGSDLLDAWQFVGPDGVGNYKLPDEYKSPIQFDPNKGGNMGSLNIPLASTEAVYQAMVQHPDWFVNTTPLNPLRRLYSSKDNLDEDTGAAFIQGDYSPTRRLQIQAGFRYEYTAQSSNMLIPLTVASMAAAGWGPASANDPRYIMAQYRNGQRSVTTNYYGVLLPSITAKYKFTPNLQLLTGVRKSYGRLSVDNIAGKWKYDDTNMIATIPNPRLTPNQFVTYSAKLDYYFEPAGNLSFTYAYRTWKGSTGDKYALSDDEINSLRDVYGADLIDNLLNQGYEIQGYSNHATGGLNIQTLTLDYRQRVPFVSGLQIRASFTRNIPSWRKTNTPSKQATFGFTYTYKNLNVQVGGTWQSRFITDTSNHYYKYARIQVDPQISYRYSKLFTLYVSARNVFNEKQAWYVQSPQYLQKHEQYGANLMFGVKGNF